MIGCDGGDGETEDGDDVLYTSSSGVENVSAKGWGGLGGKEDVVLIVVDEDEFALVELVLDGANGVEMDEVELLEGGVWISSSSSRVRSMKILSFVGLMLSLGFLALWEMVAMVEDMVVLD